jgi:hypothetical protein
MALSYESTRGGQKGVTASQAILKGLAEDGGLFMPTEIPKLDKTLEQLAGMTYQETAYEVMKLFLTDYTEEELKSFIDTNKISDIFGCNEDGSNCILKKCPIFKIIESESGNGICNAILDNYILESR